MSISPTNNLLRLRQTQQALAVRFKSLPARDRLLKGGAMALQAVAGASMAYGIGFMLHTEQAFWAAITAIAVTQLSLSDTRSSSRDQCVGALTGGVLGLVGIYLGKDSFPAYAIVVAIAIVGCWLFNAGSAARLGAITATILMLVPQHGPAWEFALIRLGEVALGTVCAILVSWVAAWLDHRFSPQVPPHDAQE